MYNEQVEAIVSYLKQNEKEKASFTLGAEFEYFVVDKKTLKAISYDESDGVLSTLLELKEKGYDGLYDNGHLVGLKKNGSTITLEPGCQLEISLKPSIKIVDLEIDYKEICLDIINLLETKNQTLLATGYQVESVIDDINLIPKKRYKYMYEYFKSCGAYAHHMMKQTASTQICIDYENEIDYINKYRILNALSPVFYAFFDNSPFFESLVYSNNSLRCKIWDCCDDSRCGIIKESFSDGFDYETYAKYLLNQSIIFKENEYTNDILFKDLYDSKNINDLEHGLSMLFPDVRTRKFIEIRMIDALPYPLNVSVIAFFKGLFYNANNLEELNYFVRDITSIEIMDVKKKIIDFGIEVNIKDYSIYDIMKYLLTLAYKGLDDIEKKYLMPITNLIQNKVTPKQLTIKQMNLGKINALKWCMLQKQIFWEEFKWMQAV